MRSPSHIITGMVLAVAVGVSLTQAVSIVAQDKLQPIPESHEIGSHSGAEYHGGTQYVDGMVNYGHCPSCRGTMQDYGGWGHCEACKRNGRIAPGTGWCAPGKVPVVRERVQYQKYYPNYWSGYGPGPAQPYKPMVYTPTDTSQLGFYYQHTPTWTAQPWRVPGPPHPAYWHNRYCGRCRDGNNVPYHYASQYGYVTGEVIDGTVEGEESTPTLATPPKAKPETNTQSPPQAIRVPQPAAPAQRPKLSLLPEAPPEV